MTRTRLDIQSVDVTLAPGETQALQLDTQSADRVLYTVDNGNTGKTSGKYNLKVRVDQDVGFGFQEVEELSVDSTTALSHTNPAYGRFMEFELVNATGAGTASNRYRIVAESMRTKY